MQLLIACDCTIVELRHCSIQSFQVGMSHFPLLQGSITSWLRHCSMRERITVVMHRGFPKRSNQGVINRENFGKNLTLSVKARPEKYCQVFLPTTTTLRHGKADWHGQKVREVLLCIWWSGRCLERQVDSTNKALNQSYRSKQTSHLIHQKLSCCVPSQKAYHKNDLNCLGQSTISPDAQRSSSLTIHISTHLTPLLLYTRNWFGKGQFEACLTTKTSYRSLVYHSTWTGLPTHPLYANITTTEMRHCICYNTLRQTGVTNIFFSFLFVIPFTHQTTFSLCCPLILSYALSLSPSYLIVPSLINTSLDCDVP